MKIAIQLPDELFAKADAFGQRSSTSFEELLSTALKEYLHRRESEEVTRSMNELIAELGQPVESHILAAGREALKRVEW